MFLFVAFLVTRKMIQNNETLQYNQTSLRVESAKLTQLFHMKLIWNLPIVFFFGWEKQKCRRLWHVFFSVLFQFGSIVWKIVSNFGFFRLSYNVIVVLTCSVMYCRCICILRKSRVNKRTRLLTFSFAANLIGWVVTVMPHLVFLDFILDGIQITFPLFFFFKDFQHYAKYVWDIPTEYLDKGTGSFHLVITLVEITSIGKRKKCSVRV